MKYFVITVVACSIGASCPGYIAVAAAFVAITSTCLFVKNGF